MVIKYEIVVTVSHKADGSTNKFTKTFEKDITASTDVMLYNNYHVIERDVYVLDMFKDELMAFCTATDTIESSVEIEEFEIVSLTDKVDAFFDFSSRKNEMDMKPTFKCYVHPKYEMLPAPKLTGYAYDSTTIVWSWEDDGYSHYLISESCDVTSEEDKDKIIATLPIGRKSYTETGLEAGTAYTRRLVSFTPEQTSMPSTGVTVYTETAEIKHSLETYKIPKEYDFTTDNREREIIKERLKAFHSGVGDFTDLKVYKQMDADFYQKFKAYFEITGRRIQREKRYDQVGFNYKICLEAKETVEEQEGEVTFDINAYPREKVVLQDYMWATKPIQVKAKFSATVLLRKPESLSERVEVKLYKPSGHKEDVTETTYIPGGTIDIPIPKPIPGTSDVDIEFEFKFSNPSCLILSIDLSGSMVDVYNGTTHEIKIVDAVENIEGKSYNTIACETGKEVPKTRLNLTKNVLTKLLCQLKRKIDKNWKKYNITLNEISSSDLLDEEKMEEIEDLKAEIGKKNYIMEYVIIGWANEAILLYDGFDVEKAIKIINGISITNSNNKSDGYLRVNGTNLGKIGTYTNFNARNEVIKSMKHNFSGKAYLQWLKKLDYDNNKIKNAIKDSIKNDGTPKANDSTDRIIKNRKQVCEILLTDGFCNTIGGTPIDSPSDFSCCRASQNGTFTEHSTRDDRCTNILNNAFKRVDKVVDSVYVCFANGFMHPDGAYLSGYYVNKPDATHGSQVAGKTGDDIRDALSAKNSGVSALNSSQKTIFLHTVEGFGYQLQQKLKELCTKKPKKWRSNIYDTSTGQGLINKKRNMKIADYDDFKNDILAALSIFASTKIEIHEEGTDDSIEYDYITVTDEDEEITEKVGEKYIFDGWEESEDTSLVEVYEIDSIKPVTITSDIYMYTFNSTITPVQYSFTEKRAIIPLSSFLEPIKMNPTSIYDLIMEKVKTTTEWTVEGYTSLVKAGEGEDNFVIQNLYIEDTYTSSDKDDKWGTEVYEPGMKGTVNVYTDMERFDTPTYGDDCYKVTKDNYLMIQGYTDAIIYDGTRLVDVELNAYDRPSAILVSASGDYGNLLFNRKNPLIVFGSGSGNMSHALELLQKDKDIIITGYPGPAKTGAVMLADPLTTDIVASISKKYVSPVLNYRFNLEDPDAKTPIYEILPDCDIESNYRHIVILHIYYAKNVYITNKDYYISSFGTDPIATISSSYMPLVEGKTKWTLKEWKDGIGKENGWFIDNYLWFMAKPMKKTRDYYDELPGHGDTFYGLVNGRYREDGMDGKKDLIVDTPQFNIPTTVDKSTIKIYIMITEFYPDTAIVYYKWDHPLNGKDSITNVNGDYVTFGSDSITYKDVEYMDVLSTINMANQEIYDHKDNTYLYELEKPKTVYDYINYYLKVTTDNSDVLAMRYPTEITFDDKGLASVGVTFKGVVNATSKWSPRIHNGYYYLNQHEYFAYSEFNVEANFDTYEETNYKTISGYISFDVSLRHKASPEEHYSVKKDTRSELLQDEEHFQWVNGKGLTLKPSIDGIYYREYEAYTYTAPVIMFPHQLTKAGILNVNYDFSDGSKYLPMQVRSYNLEDGKWSEWTAFTNGTVPTVPLSSAYQVRFMLSASVTHKALTLEDYLCCYLDWQDEMDANNITNIVTITDHMTTGPDKAQGIFISKIFDYGCKTTLKLDLYESAYKNYIQLYVAYSDDNQDALLLENAAWNTVSSKTGYKGRYFRYKIVIPEGEKLYWLHKVAQTQETSEVLPYVTAVSMSGDYKPSDVTASFINIEAFEIPKDGKEHIIFDRVEDVIGADVLTRGFAMSEIEKVDIKCTTSDITIKYDSGFGSTYPSATTLATPIKASAEIDTEIIIKNTPFIFVERDDLNENDIVKIKGTPQQYCPITVEDPDGNAFLQLHNTKSFVIEEETECTEETKYIELSTNRYDPKMLKIYIDDVLQESGYHVQNHLVIFDDFVKAGSIIKSEFCILYSFIAVIDRKENTTVIYLHTGEDYKVPEKVRVFFETNIRNNKFIANELSLNPIYRTDYKGFIYLTDDHNEPYKINIYCNPLRLKAGGYDKVDIQIEVLDVKGNSVIAKDIAVDCDGGILNCDSYTTDMNGVVHIVYESAYKKCNDVLTAKAILDDGVTVIQESITIINE